ncbi:MAG: hypothetical protein QM730_17605 [Anaerolineales bacterium]
MTRKIIISVFASVYMVVGLLNFYNSLFPSLSSSGIFILRLFPLIGGALAFYAGLTLFRQNDFGRQLVVVLLFLRVFINALYFFRMSKDVAWLGIENHLGEIIFRIESPYAFQGFLLAWIIIALLTALFLLQSETKKIFESEVIKDAEPGIIFED